MAEALTGDVWLQTEQTDGTYVCESYSGVPVARPGWIALVSSGSSEGRSYVRQLREELEAVLLSSSPEARKMNQGCPEAGPETMNPENYRERRKLLVLFGSHHGPELTDQSWYNRWESDQYDSGVMTVLPSGKFEDFFDPKLKDDMYETHLLRRVNASYWQDKVTESLPAVMAQAGITTMSARVFISYRRLETLPVALQLFDALTHEGFEVFLDRFTIPPGYDFQRRLNQELEDKSMVLLLESRNAKRSKWTQHEIDFAKRHRLGLFAVQMPDVDHEDRRAVSGSAGGRPNEAFEAIYEDARIRLEYDLSVGKSDFEGAPRLVDNPDDPATQMNEWPRLSQEALKIVLQRVKTAHADALFRRRHRLRKDLVAELEKHEGIHVDYQSAGPLLVNVGSDQHLFWLTTRPPEVDDFRSTYFANLQRPNLSATSRAVVLGPQAALEPDRLARLKWLEEVSQCVAFDEGQLVELANCVLGGNWP